MWMDVEFGLKSGLTTSLRSVATHNLKCFMFKEMVETVRM